MLTSIYSRLKDVCSVPDSGIPSPKHYTEEELMEAGRFGDGVLRNKIHRTATDKYQQETADLLKLETEMNTLRQRRIIRGDLEETIRAKTIEISGYSREAQADINGIRKVITCEQKEYRAYCYKQKLPLSRPSEPEPPIKIYTFLFIFGLIESIAASYLYGGSNYFRDGWVAAGTAIPVSVTLILLATGIGAGTRYWDNDDPRKKILARMFTVFSVVSVFGIGLAGGWLRAGVTPQFADMLAAVCLTLSTFIVSGLSAVKGRGLFPSKQAQAYHRMIGDHHKRAYQKAIDTRRLIKNKQEAINALINGYSSEISDFDKEYIGKSENFRMQREVFLLQRKNLMNENSEKNDELNTYNKFINAANTTVSNVKAFTNSEPLKKTPSVHLNGKFSEEYIQEDNFLLCLQKHLDSLNEKRTELTNVVIAAEKEIEDSLSRLDDTALCIDNQDIKQV